MTKEEYKAMKVAWAESVNDKSNHSYKHKKYGNKVKGKIYSVHYLVYNVLRMMPEERGFEPVGEGFKEAQWWFSRLLRSEKYYEELLFPFKGTVTIEQLQALL
jgi:hypothetical protein